MRILITGSSGEIGTNLALKLMKEGHEVFGVDCRPNSWTDAFPYILQDLSAKFINFTGGIGDEIYPDKLDAVVHLAANAKVHELVAEPWRAFDNIAITFNVLEFCRVNKLPVIYASSREVYGDVKRFSTEESQTHVSFTESPYSASKIGGEAFVYAYAKCYGLPYLVFRFSNVYGRFDNDADRMERVMPIFIKKISNDEPIRVFGRDKTLDFTYVDDTVNGIVLGLKKILSGEVRNETINLAYGEGHTLLDLVKYIGEETGKKPDMTVEESKVGEVTYYVADISKAKKLLGYSPEVGLREGVHRAIKWQKEWLRQNPNSKIQMSKNSGMENVAAGKKLNILFFSAFFPPFRGGAEVFVEEAGRRLAQKHNVTVLTARLDRKLSREEIINGMRIIRLGFGCRWDKYLFPKLAFLRSFTISHDIVYGVLESYAGLAIAIYKLFSKRPAILNLQSGTLDDWKRGHGLNLLLRRWIHGSPDAIHAISQHLAGRAKMLGAKNVTVIPNGTELDRFILNAGRNKDEIICVGRLYPVKGTDIVLDAMSLVLKEFPEAKLRVVGDGPDKKMLEDKAVKLGIKGSIIFAGNLSHDLVPKELASAAIFAGASRREGQGIAYVEAQAAGCAVIGTRVGGIPEVIADGANGLLVKPEDPQDMARAIISLFKDPARAKRLADAGRKNSLRYDWRNIVSEVERLIIATINKHA